MERSDLGRDPEEPERFTASFRDALNEPARWADAQLIGEADGNMTMCGWCAAPDFRRWPSRWRSGTGSTHQII